MANLIYFSIIFSISLLLSLVLTPVVLRIAIKFNVIDAPGDRKSHERELPSMGGLAIFFSFFMTLAFSCFVSLFWNHFPVFSCEKTLQILLSSLPLLVVGILDDKYRLNYKIKLLAQIVSGMLMIYFGYLISGITNPFTSQTIPLGFFSVPITLFWFLFIINSINLIDGMDGLAAGVVLIAVTTLSVISVYLGNFQVAAVSIILAGAIVGFLRYNFLPASIFMGDTGSLFLGFMLASLSLVGAQKSSTAVAIAIPIAILGLPILDAVMAVMRRWSAEWSKAKTIKDRLFSWQKVFFADRQHIHHRLLDLGITKRQAVVFLYLISLGFGLIGFVLTAARLQYVAFVLIYMGIVFFIAFRKFPAVKMQITSFGSVQPGEAGAKSENVQTVSEQNK